MRERYLKEAERYDKERKDISARADELAAQRKITQERGGRFTRALIALQIAIVLSSVSGVTKKRWLWLLSLVVGVFGIGLFGYSYFL